MNSPKKTSIETERLFLRQLSADDLDLLAPILADPEVMQFSLNGPMTQEETEAWIKRMTDLYQEHGFGAWAVIHKESGEFIGFSCLSYVPIGGKKELELGYRLSRASWGKGFAPEACMGVRDYAFNILGVNSFISVIEAANTRSLRVAEKFGSHYLRDDIFFEIPVRIYQCSKTES